MQNTLTATRSNKRAIIAHLGCGKTGTSSLQHFLAAHAEALKLRGFRYAAS
jgi:hypothetical protein